MNKYRGKTEDTNKEIYGYHVVIEGVHYIVLEKAVVVAGMMDDVVLKGLIQVLPESVGQSTGEFDRCEGVSERKEIYAGDIVTFEREYGFSGAIQTKTITDIVEYHKGQYTIGEYTLNEVLGEWSLEIIGNATDNPELI